MGIKIDIASLAAAAIAVTALTSCFTGIESTPRITEADVRRAGVVARPEASYLADILPEPPASWSVGKRWAITDPRSSRAFGADLAGDTILFTGITEAMSITGRPEAIITFDSSRGPVSYRTDISADSLSRRSAFPLPYAVELSMIDEVAKRMTGRTYYILTALWTSPDGQSIRGRKYLPVKTVSVEPGEGVAPIRLTLETAQADSPAQRFTIAMAAPGGSSGTSTRDFANLFSLTDPRLRYPKITDAVWANIQAGRVVPDMTRDECRLALGSPSEVNRQAGYSDLYEVWTYGDGLRLIFTDGILTSVNR